MTLNAEALRTPNTPEWWMSKLAAKMLDKNRLKRLAILDAYRAGRPPLLEASPSQRAVTYSFLRCTRTNFARVVVRAPAERMAVRSIRTAAADDDNGDEIANRMWTGAGLDVAETDVYTGMLTFADHYVRVAQGPDQPVALSCDPWNTITVPDPLDPLKALAAMHLAWDEWSEQVYAYLWLPGRQWVASMRQASAPPTVLVDGTKVPGRWRQHGIPRFQFNPQQFTMRPNRDDVDKPDGGPYSETYKVQDVPVQWFPNRDGIGEFEEHLDLLDRINTRVLVSVVTAAIQAYKQRALEQPADAAKDMLPEKDPNTGEPINWDEIFQPGPDALWKLPPGVKIWESGEVQMQGQISSIQEDIKQLSSVTSTPFSLFSPDGVNQSAEGAQATREGLVFKVEDRDKIAARSWSRVLSLMFAFAGEDQRADAGRIIIDWKPSERYSLAEKASADSANKSLSTDMVASKIWGLSPDEVAINRAQRAGQALLTPPAANAPSSTPAEPSGQPGNQPEPAAAG